MSAALLACKDLQPGVYYRVVDPGDADPVFKGSVVLGTPRRTGYARRAITVWMPSPEDLAYWAGIPWHADVDTYARFEVYEEAYVKT